MASLRVISSLMLLLGILAPFGAGCRGQGDGVKQVDTHELTMHGGGGVTTIAATDPRHGTIMAELHEILSASGSALFLAIDDDQIADALEAGALEVRFAEPLATMPWGECEPPVTRLLVMPSVHLGAGDGSVLVIAGHPEWSAGPWLSSRPVAGLESILDADTD